MDPQSIDRVSAQRALEALRNGVPNSDAVRALGCMQPAALDAFQTRLDRLDREGPGGDVIDGVLIAGGFGSGKSHTLAYLEQQALERNFIVSRVVVSKETPLHDLARLYLAAVREARLPRSRGALLPELALRLDYRSEAGETFLDWAQREQPYGIVAASVAIHERSKDSELLEKVVNYWAGEKLAVQEVRNGLKNLELQKAYEVKTVKIADLAPVRFEFVARLAHAVGFRGWVVLLDELELIARYSLTQRAKAYGELARCLGARQGQSVPGTLFVGAITDDFALDVLDQRGDRSKIPQRIGDRGDTKNLALSAMATVGMDLIQKKAITLNPPNDDTLQASHDRLARLYSIAYGAPPSGAFQAEREAHRAMRSYVRRWIWGWDLARIDPSSRPAPEEEDIKMTPDEDPDFSASDERSDNDE